MTRDPSFEVVTQRDPDSTLLVGLADVGVAGLTAVDYLTTQTDAEQIGSIRTQNLPDITPFADGTPRQPMRLYSLPNSDITVCLGELLLPVSVADLFAETLTEWADTTAIEELTCLYGASFPHAEEAHRVSSVATESFRARHDLASADIDRLTAGFFDGVVAELLAAGMEPSGPPVGTLVTPAHVPGPDFEASIRLIEAFSATYAYDIDTTDLHDRSAEMRRYYETLAERMATLRDDSGDDRFADDRMFM